MLALLKNTSDIYLNFKNKQTNDTKYMSLTTSVTDACSISTNDLLLLNQTVFCWMIYKAKKDTIFVVFLLLLFVVVDEIKIVPVLPFEMRAGNK